jgi:hypothetical protein
MTRGTIIRQIASLTRGGEKAGDDHDCRQKHGRLMGTAQGKPGGEFEKTGNAQLADNDHHA